MKKLLIVESPGKIKTIKKYLGDEWEVKASVGHISDLPKKELGIDKKNGFKPTYEISSDKKDVVKGLSSAVKSAGKENVYLATDEDREGEAISYHLCKNLGLDYKTTKRITFNEITEPAIKAAIKNPRLLDLKLVGAQEARRVIDRLVGFEVSPVLWKKIQSDTPLSAGRVQSVALKMVVEREKEIQNFQAKDNFKVSATFLTKENNKLKAVGSLTFDGIEETKSYLSNAFNKKFKVVSIKKEPKKTNPQPPFSTSTLQQDANKKLKFAVGKTMEVAQKLYESGYITYMRTDSVNLSETAIDLASKFIKETYGSEFLEVRQFKNKSANAQEAHEAVRPSSFNTKEIDGSEDEKALYKLIYLRAIASQMKAKETDVTTILIRPEDIQGDFKAVASLITFEGFTKAYSEIKDEEANEEEETEIKEDIKEGDSLSIFNLTGTQTYSKPKGRYDEAELVKDLETKGIGRPSTYASILKNIKDTRKYISLSNAEGKKFNTITIVIEGGQISEKKGTVNIGAAKGKLMPNPIAFTLIDFLETNFNNIMDYDFTANCEENFDKIASGQTQFTNVVSSFYAILEPAIGRADQGYKDVEGRERKTVDIGSYEGKTVSAGKGEYGVYVKHNDKFINIPQVEDYKTITLEMAIEAIQGKKQAEKDKKEAVAANTLYTFGKHKIVQGEKGPYVTNGTDKAPVPKWELDKLDSFNEDKCKEVIKNFKAFLKKKK